MSPNVQPIEIFWTITALFAVIFGAYSMVEVVLDRWAVSRAKVGNGRRRYSNSAVRNEAGRLLLQGFFLFVGVRALHAPPPPDDGAAIARAFIVALECYFLACSVLDFRWRRGSDHI